MNFYRDDSELCAYVLCAKSDLGFGLINRDDWAGVKNYRASVDVKPVISYEGDEPKMVEDGFYCLTDFKTLKQAKQYVRDFLES